MVSSYLGVEPSLAVVRHRGCLDTVLGSVDRIEVLSGVASFGHLHSVHNLETLMLLLRLQIFRRGVQCPTQLFTSCWRPGPEK